MVSRSSELDSSANSASPDITNKDVYSYFKEHRGLKDCKGIENGFLEHFGVEILETKAAGRNSMYKKIKNVHDTCTNKMKTPAKKAKYLSQKFNLPISRVEYETKFDTPRKKALKRKIRDEKAEKACA